MENNKNDYLLSFSVLLSALLLSASWVYTTELKIKAGSMPALAEQALKDPETNEILPEEGVVLPVVWNNLGARLISTGVIDAEKLSSLEKNRGTFTEENKNLLYGQNNGKIKITKNNAGYLLNLFWALGLSSKNPILDYGEMSQAKYGGAENFASTGGWTLSEGNSMDHYSRHKFFDLTPEQQALVDKISNGIYRPCCGNSAHFPDCNHGMAMLGLLELMASQGVSEKEMWETALTVNSFWFPDTYLTIAAYMKNKGTEWKNVNPQEMLGSNFSSASGFKAISAKIIPSTQKSANNGCSI